MALSNFISAIQRLQPAAPPSRGGTISFGRVGPVPVPVYQPPKPAYQPPRPAPVSSPILTNYGYSAPPQNYAVAPPLPIPQPDIAGLQAKARQAAEGAVNPWYTRQLNDFLADQATKRQLEEQQYNLTVKQAEEAEALKQKNLEETSKLRQKNLEDVLGMNLKLYEQALSQTLKENEITKGRTIEDVGTEKARINQQADIFQRESGQQFAAEREGTARELAARGLTGGLGAQAQEALTERRSTAEGLQEEQFTQARIEKDLFQNRTVSDLMRSGELAKEAKALKEEGARLDTAQGKALAAQEEAQGKEGAKLTTAQTKAKAKFDIDSYYATYGQSSDKALGVAPLPFERAKRDALDKQRREEINAEESRQRQAVFEDWLTKLVNPAQWADVSRTYGGFFK